MCPAYFFIFAVVAFASFLGQCIAGSSIQNLQGARLLAAVSDATTYKAFNNVATMPLGRSDMVTTTFSSSFFKDGQGPRIYLTGGCIAHQVCDETSINSTIGSTSLSCFCPEITNICDYFTPLTEKWHTDCAPAHWLRYRHAGAAVGHYLFVAGGRTVEDHIILAIEQYDVLTGIWTNPFNWTAEDATSDGGAFGWQNKLFLVGGYNSDYSVSSNKLVSFDITTGEYKTSYPAMQFGRGDISVIPLLGDHFYVIAGFSVGKFCTPTNVTEVYTPANNSWTTIPHMHHGRGDLAVGVIDNFLFAVGGETKVGGKLDPSCSHSVPVSEVERLRKNHSQWAQEEDIPVDLFRFIGGSFNSSETPGISPAIFLFGGQGTFDPLSSTYPLKNSTIKYVPYYIYLLTASSSQSSEVLSKGGIAGVVIAAVVVAICICCAVVGFLEYKRRGFYTNLDVVDKDDAPKPQDAVGGPQSTKDDRRDDDANQSALMERSFDDIHV